jgi:hypothetical protein
MVQQHPEQRNKRHGGGGGFHVIGCIRMTITEKLKYYFKISNQLEQQHNLSLNKHSGYLIKHKKWRLKRYTVLTLPDRPEQNPNTRIKVIPK